MRIYHFFILFFLFFSVKIIAQHHHHHFTEQDTLRGTITPEREWWDLNFYHLSVEVFPETKTIKGSNVIEYTVLEEGSKMQIDLQPPLKITKVTQNNKTLDFERNGNVFYINFKEKQLKDERNKIIIFYEGIPQESVRPPWEGGFTFTKDSNGKHFIATSCQGDGASLWWPCKDHYYDEPDSMLMSITVPKDLMDVSNGRLREVTENENDTKTFHWFVSNPINNYGVNINIGDYVHFSEIFEGENGNLDCNYYVLRENLSKAKKQFKDAKRTLEAFEYWFGPYPFYEDSYKLVEAPYLGMEHQSSVTYGNGYENGYLGRDLSDTGWGLKFDFIIVHESGHEWFANSITQEDVADMWIHEGFTNYSENLFLDYHFGKKAAQDYVIGCRENIRNDRPIIGTYNVNHKGSTDMYYKGANLLHNLRTILDDDEKWREILRGINKDFYHQVVTSQQIEHYLSQNMGMNLIPVFDQYLRDTRIPVLEFAIRNGELRYKWGNCVEDFNMPVDIYIEKEKKRIQPTTKYQTLDLETRVTDIKIDRNYYVGKMNILGE